MDIKKPSPRFMKYGWLAPSEPYDARIHNIGNTIAKRNIHRDDGGNFIGYFYNAASIQGMKGEIKKAQCPICLKQMDDNNSCRVCDKGHKFHYKCDNDQQYVMLICPTCRSEDISTCGGDFFDTFSGGKKSKRKTYRKKKNRKRRTNRKKV